MSFVVSVSCGFVGGFSIFFGGFNNTYFENNIIGNNVAVECWGDPSNVFYRNNFINNVVMETPEMYQDLGSSPTWDNGTQGNYYSDYLTKYPAAKETNSTGTYDTPYAITLQTIYIHPQTFLFYDNHPLINPVEISQTPTTTPSWTTSTPTNQAVLTYIVIIAVAAVLSILVVSFLLYRKHRKQTSPIQNATSP